PGTLRDTAPLFLALRSGWLGGGKLGHGGLERCIAVANNEIRPAVHQHVTGWLPVVHNEQPQILANLVGDTTDAKPEDPALATGFILGRAHEEMNLPDNALLCRTNLPRQIPLPIIIRVQNEAVLDSLQVAGGCLDRLFKDDQGQFKPGLLELLR